MDHRFNQTQTTHKYKNKDKEFIQPMHNQTIRRTHINDINKQFVYIYLHLLNIQIEKYSPKALNKVVFFLFFKTISNFGETKKDFLIWNSLR